MNSIFTSIWSLFFYKGGWKGHRWHQYGTSTPLVWL